MARAQFLEIRYAPLGNTFLPDLRQAWASVPRRSRSYSHGSSNLLRNHDSAKLHNRGKVPDSGDALSSAARTPSFQSLPTALGDGAADQGPGVTLVIQNLPRRAVQEVVLAELESSGHGSSLDFLHVPAVCLYGRRPLSKGFGFVRMKSRKAAKDLVDQWDGTLRFGGGKGSRKLRLLPARIQGAKETIETCGEGVKETLETCGEAGTMSPGNIQ